MRMLACVLLLLHLQASELPHRSFSLPPISKRLVGTKSSQGVIVQATHRRALICHHDMFPRPLSRDHPIEAAKERVRHVLGREVLATRLMALSGYVTVGTLELM